MPETVSTVKRLLDPAWDDIKKLYNQRSRAKTINEIKQLDNSITAIVNDINSLELDGKKIKVSQLSLGKVDDLASFKAGKYYAKYKEKAQKALLEGEYVPQFLFAGAATRFGLGSMWGLDLAAIGDVILGNYREARRYLDGKSVGRVLITLGNDVRAMKFLSKKDFDEFKLSKPTVLTTDEVSRARAKLQKHRVKTKPVHMGMGPRQLISFRNKLEKLSKKLGVDKSKAVSSVKMVINLNKDVIMEAHRDLIKNSFYGFNPENIYIAIQPTYKGRKLRGSTLIEDKSKEALPFGHGYATMQMVSAGESIRLTSAGKGEVVEQSVIDELYNRGCTVMGTHRINDMTKWTDDVVDMDRLAYGMFQMQEKGKEVVVELVENPHNQKGGHWLAVNGKQFLAETLSTSRPDIKAFIHSLEKVPYNAFRNMYSIKALRDKLTQSSGIKFNLRYKTGNFYLEAVTGDITLIMNSVAFRKQREVIHDIKNIRHYVEYLGDGVRLTG